MENFENVKKGTVLYTREGKKAIVHDYREELKPYPLYVNIDGCTFALTQNGMFSSLCVEPYVYSKIPSELPTVTCLQNHIIFLETEINHINKKLMEMSEKVENLCACDKEKYQMIKDALKRQYPEEVNK